MALPCPQEEILMAIPGNFLATEADSEDYLEPITL
jgi:hypothetical protein